MCALFTVSSSNLYLIRYLGYWCIFQKSSRIFRCIPRCFLLLGRPGAVYIECGQMTDIVEVRFFYMVKFLLP